MATPREAPITVRRATEQDRATAMSFIPPNTPRGRASLVLLKTGQGLLWVAVEGDDSGDGRPEGGEAGPLPQMGQAEKVVGLLLATVQIDAESEEPVGYIQELLVHPAYRRRGAAMHLLDAAERYFLEEQRFALISLATSPDNDAALRLYRSRGYTVYQVRLSKRRADVPSRPDASPR